MSRFDDELSYDEAREIRDHLASLFDHAGWKLVEEILKDRVEVRQKELYSLAPTSVEQMCMFNRVKGGLDELQGLAGILHQMYSDLDTQIKKVHDEEDDAYPTSDGAE